MKLGIETIGWGVVVFVIALLFSLVKSTIWNEFIEKPYREETRRNGELVSVKVFQYRGGVIAKLPWWFSDTFEKKGSRFRRKVNFLRIAIGFVAYLIIGAVTIISSLRLAQDMPFYVSMAIYEAIAVIAFFIADPILAYAIFSRWYGSKSTNM